MYATTLIFFISIRRDVYKNKLYLEIEVLSVTTIDRP